MKYLSILGIVLLCIFGCKDNRNHNLSDCTQNRLAELNMVPYDGQDLGCNTYLLLDHYEGEEYFMQNNACANMIYLVVDCNGNVVCSDAGINSSVCDHVFIDRDKMSIVGIAE